LNYVVMLSQRRLKIIRVLSCFVSQRMSLLMADFVAKVI